MSTSKNFDDAFSWVGYNSFISELNVYRAINPGKAFYGIPKWTMKELDKVKPTRIRGLNFPEANVVSAKFLPLKDMLVESVNVEERKVTFVKSNRPDGPKYIVTFYSFTRVLKQCLTIGRIVNLAAQKVYGDDKNGFTMVQPVIVPKNVAFKELKGVKFRSRTIPARIYNLAWSEFNFRFGRKAAKNVDEEMEKDFNRLKAKREITTVERELKQILEDSTKEKSSEDNKRKKVKGIKRPKNVKYILYKNFDFDFEYLE